MEKLITVLISTRNRPDYMPDILNSLSRNKLELFEVVVVDQSTNTESKQYVETFIKDHTEMDLKYILSDTKGLSISRNIGIENAKGKIILFTDDDCIVDDHWVENVAKVFESDEFHASYGRVLPYIPEGEELPPNYEPVACVFGEERIEFASLNPDDFFKIGSGNNMAYRKSVFDEMGDFEPKLGAGAVLKSGEDLEMAYRVLKNGKKILYNPEALVHHKQWRRTGSMLKTAHGYFFGLGVFLWVKALQGDKEPYAIFKRLHYNGYRFMLSGIRKLKPIRIISVLVQTFSLWHARIYVLIHRGY